MNEENVQSEDLKEVIAANLAHLRQEAGLTQLQLAEMLNYSDKAVSKWERGESIPDLRVLIKLAEIYHISLDDLVRSKPGKRLKPRLNLKKKHVLITLLSIGLVGVIATAIFMIFFYIVPLKSYAYLAYVCAPVAASIVFTVFSALWYRRITMAIAASLVLWSVILVVHVFLSLFTQIPVWPFYLVAGGMQILIAGWFVLRKLYKPEKKAE
ncbi:MAG: helix-turn-helix domain-containing protein [Candidatus Coproplasma sp.]